MQIEIRALITQDLFATKFLNNNNCLCLFWFFKPSNNSNKAFLGILKPIKINLNLRHHIFKKKLCQFKNLRNNSKKYVQQWRWIYRQGLYLDLPLNLFVLYLIELTIRNVHLLIHEIKHHVLKIYFVILYLLGWYMEFCPKIWYYKWNISKISSKDKTKIKSTFQHKFSILHGSIVVSLIKLSSVLL